jgi:aryl-phospho-beta-D-glucosidase BglC (GH1 family)
MTGIVLRQAAVLCALLLFAAAHPQPGTRQPVVERKPVGNEAVFQRAATLTRGINTSGWFGGSTDYSLKHTSTYITIADLRAMRAMGIQYIRFPFDPALLEQNSAGSANNEQLWRHLDDALDMVQSAGLDVDFVVFPTDDYKQRLLTQDGLRQFILLWQLLSKHFARRDPDCFFFELINEPKVQDRYRWIGIEGQVVKAIRQIDQQHTILASGANWDGLEDLLDTDSLPDPNIIYTFHYYEPYAFTHQGATWAESEFTYYKSIPYPVTPEMLAQKLKSISGDRARYRLYLYGAEGWNRTGISERLAFAADWGRERHVPVICNEFGAYRDTTPEDSRARYLEDVRSGLEKLGIGWAMWDWSENFGLVRRKDGAIVADAAIQRALGLKTPQ